MSQRELDQLRREWRRAFEALAQAERIPPLERVAITALPVIRANGAARRRGAGGCFGAVEAAIDGLIAAGVVVGPERVVALHMLAPAIGESGRLVVVVADATQHQEGP